MKFYIAVSAIVAVNAVVKEKLYTPAQQLMEVARQELKPGEEDEISTSIDDYDENALDIMTRKTPKEFAEDHVMVQTNFVDEAKDIIDDTNMDTSDVQLRFNTNNREMVQIASKVRWEDDTVPKFGNEMDMDDEEENLQAYDQFDFHNARGENL